MKDYDENKRDGAGTGSEELSGPAINEEGDSEVTTGEDALSGKNKENPITVKDKKKLNPLEIRSQQQIFAILHFTRNHLVEFMGLSKDNEGGA